MPKNLKTTPGSDPDGLWALGRASPAGFRWVRVQERVPGAQVSAIIFIMELNIGINWCLIVLSQISRIFAFREQCQDFAQVRMPLCFKIKSTFIFKIKFTFTFKIKPTFTFYILVTQALLDHTRSSYELEVLIFLNLQIIINIIVNKPLTMTITEGFTEPRPKRSNLSTWGADAFEQVDDKGKYFGFYAWSGVELWKCSKTFDIICDQVEACNQVWPKEVCGSPKCSAAPGFHLVSNIVWHQSGILNISHISSINSHLVHLIYRLLANTNARCVRIVCRYEGLPGFRQRNMLLQGMEVTPCSNHVRPMPLEKYC